MSKNEYKFVQQNFDFLLSSHIVHLTALQFYTVTFWSQPDPYIGNHWAKLAVYKAVKLKTPSKPATNVTCASVLRN